MYSSIITKTYKAIQLRFYNSLINKKNNLNLTEIFTLEASLKELFYQIIFPCKVIEI